MRRLTILLSILILSQNSVAGITLSSMPGVISITKNTPAPYDGVLFSNDKAKELYADMQECDAQKQANVSLLKSLTLMQSNQTIYEAQVSELKIQNETLDTALVKAQSNGFWNRAMYFGLGVLTTGLIVYAARK